MKKLHPEMDQKTPWAPMEEANVKIASKPGAKVRAHHLKAILQEEDSVIKSFGEREQEQVEDQRNY